MEQPAIHEGELLRCQALQFCGQFGDLAGSQKAHAAQVHTQNRLAVPHTGESGPQQRSVAADGHDLVRRAIGVSLRQKLYPGKPALTREGLRHQHLYAQPGQHSSSLPRNGKPCVLGGVRNQQN